jgi:predicted nuclease with RNAse H fold
VSKAAETWIGVDPGGEANFGLSILNANGSCHTCTVNYVDAAVETILKHVHSMPAAIGVDAPLWWSSGSGGLRKADQWIRDQYGLHHRNVQAVMFVTRIREVFPGVRVTETHPKAVLVALGRELWEEQLSAIPTTVTLDSKPDHERDALISGIAAREGFEGRWKKDLIEDRYPCEQNPLTHWLAPVHYLWPA